MEMVYVPEGSFEMGSITGDEDEKPVRLIYLDAYWIDKYEVTNAQYAQCVSEGACTRPGSTSSYTRENYFGNASYTDYPVVHITWYQAQNYCQWTGGNLPTEAQWEKAARGTDKREYPWGNEVPDYDRANYDLSIGDTTSVGSYSSGASPYGAMDLAGNVGEWVQDGFAPYSLEKVYNPIGTFNTPYRAIRGGNYFDLPSDIRSAYRFYGEPNLSGYDIGFRCTLPAETSELSKSKVYQGNFANLPEPTPISPAPSPTPTFQPTPTSFINQAGVEMVFVPAGSFMMGSEDGLENEKPIHEVYLDAFYIDKYEVSNAQYEKCVNAGSCSIPNDAREYTYTDSNYYGNSDFADYPVILVTWYNARDYCTWAGGQLPTEAQWEKAARGDGIERSYPWGDGVAGNLANFCDSNCEFEQRNIDVNDGFVDTAPVGSYPAGASPYGAMDMAGNVWEWVSDFYQEDYYSNSPTSNPTGPSNGDYKVVRGGGWVDNMADLQSVRRVYGPHWIGVEVFGFRCVTPAP